MALIFKNVLLTFLPWFQNVLLICLPLMGRALTGVSRSKSDTFPTTQGHINLNLILFKNVLIRKALSDKVTTMLLIHLQCYVFMFFLICI